MTSRRQFLKQAALATGGVLVSASSWGHFFLPKNKKVIIIGGGFAGLSAAYTLFKKGIHFELLESRNNVGGRVFSHTIDQREKLVVELGAEWVGEDHHLLREFCDRMHLPLDNNQFNSQVIYRGKHYNKLDDIMSKSWEAKYDQLIDWYRNLPEDQKDREYHRLDKTDWWRVLVDHGCTGNDLDLRELLDSTDFGETIRQVSAYAAIDEYARSSKESKNEMDYKIRGGNQQLAYKFRNLFPDRIKTGYQVSKIAQPPGGKVRVYCTNGYSVEGDKIICTIPTFAVKKIDWQPGLSGDMLYAIDALQYARINKNALLFGNRFWKQEDFDMITDMPGHYFYHATKNQSSRKGALISYTIGDKAAVVANQTDEWRAEMIQQSLNPAFPDIKKLLEKQENYYWGNNDYSQGAYAIYGKGQWFDLFDKLGTPHINTYFAGEHLSENWGGFMEGALETGRHAAEQI